MSTDRVSWTDLPAGAPEPPPLSIVMAGDTLWCRPKVPGRPDGWYRVGGGRGESVLDWEDLAAEAGPMFIGEPPAAQVLADVLEAALAEKLERWRDDLVKIATDSHEHLATS